MIGRAALADDPEFRGVGGRLRNSDAVNGYVQEWVGTRTVAEVIEILGPDGAGVPCSPVYTVDQLLTHPQLLAREMILRFPHPKLGEVVIPGVVPKLSDTPARTDWPGRALGADTRAVLIEVLGLSEEEIAALGAAGVVAL